ncbi:MAG: dienelactone hydrolase family protein [Gammaproteobacteria bacterium]|nr:dienelactone hydrolase family protein [Gammaproteobacteria bacterium]
MLKKILLTVVALLILAAAGIGYLLWPASYQPAYRMSDVALADFRAAPSGEVWFPGFNARSARDLLEAGANAVAEPVLGTLVLPAEASAAAPVPAVVILHGSGGDFTHRSVHLAQKLAAVGIAGFAVDTFRSRKLTAEDDYFARMEKASIYTQIADAFNALEALQAHPFIRGDRIGVAGFSLGASSAMFSAFEPVATPMMGREGARFAAHIMFYTGCNMDFEDFRLDGAPWLVMLGSADESTPPGDCRELLAKAERLQGVHAELEVYEGAAHGWNMPEPLSFHEDAFVTRDCTAYWTREGRVIEKNSGYSYDNPLSLLLAFSQCATRGYSMGRHDQANRQSVRDTVDFLDRVWDGQWSARLTGEILGIGIPPEPGQDAS